MAQAAWKRVKDECFTFVKKGDAWPAGTTNRDAGSTSGFTGMQVVCKHCNYACAEKNALCHISGDGKQVAAARLCTAVPKSAAFRQLEV